MKKLIALLIVLALCFSSCELLTEFVEGSNPTVEEQTETPEASNPEDGDPDGGNGSGNNTGTGSGSGTGTGSGSGTGTGSGSGTGTGSGSGTGTGSGSGSGSGTGCDGKHTDVNDDGKCDDCSISVIVVVDVFALNDLHGKISATSTQYGLGRLTTYLNRETDDNSILLSSGDMWQGSAESNLTYGAFVTEWMNRMNFASMTLGNHEYDWSETYISSNAALAEFPLLAINVYDKTTGKRAEYATPSIVIERDGVQIGIIGAIGDCYSSISGDVAGNFTFKVGDELTKLVKDEADRLRAEGVDFIIYSLHDGYGSGSSGIKNVSNNALSSYYDASLSNGYVDLVFEGHTHQSYILLDTYGVYHMQGGGENKSLSRAEININSANGNTAVKTVTIVSQSTWSSLSEDPLVAELLLKYEDVISKADMVLGNNKKYLDDSEVEQIVANLYYQYGVETWGSQYEITLGGGFLKTRSPYNLKSGEILYSDVYSLLPFDNDLVLCSISGKDLLDKFINTTNTDYYICAGVDINTLKNSIDSSKTYYVVVDSYTSSYKYNNLTEITRMSGVYARDLLAEYIMNGGLA